jgi:hypothetical protein
MYACVASVGPLKILAFTNEYIILMFHFYCGGIPIIPGGNIPGIIPGGIIPYGICPGGIMPGIIPGGIIPGGIIPGYIPGIIYGG